MRGLLAELQRRNVLRVAVAYLALGWLLLQVGMLMSDLLGLPRDWVRVLFILLLLGFLPALLLTWLYELTPDGLRRESTIDRALQPSGAEPRSRRFDLAIIGVLVLVVATLVIERKVRPAAVAPAPTAGAPRASVEQGPANTPAPGSNTPPGVATPSPTSLAVLPFTNLSGDAQQEYFSDGLSEELIFLLARVPQLRVTGRTSSFSFKGKQASVTDIGRELKVATVLEGSVRRSGEQLRVTTQLINVADGFPLWGQTYNREITDVFAMQDEIASKVVEALKVELLPGQRPALSTHRTTNPDAYDQYLLGKELFRHSTPEDWVRAAAAFEKAVELDPGFAAAYAELAYAAFFASHFAGSGEERDRGQARAEAAAEKALALDPQLAAGYAYRGAIRSLRNLDWAAADADFRHALELDPSDPVLQRRYATFLYRVGRLDEAVATAIKANELDPLSFEAWNSLGFYENARGRLQEARRALNRSIALSPANPYANFNLGCNSLMQGNAARALEEFRNVPEGHFLRAAGIAMAHHVLGNRRESAAALEDLLKMRAAPPFWVAGVYSIRGERDLAFDWLERSYAQRDIYLAYVKVNPLVANLRSDPRYDALLRKLGLE